MDRTHIPMLAAAMLACTLCFASGSSDSGVKMSKGVELYNSGLYGPARQVFESFAGDPLADGWSVLCAVREGSSDARRLLRTYTSDHGSTILSTGIDWQMALSCFDEELYGEAVDWFGRLPEKRLEDTRRPEYLFKLGYCHFAQGYYPEAMSCFRELELLTPSDYTAPARYAMGYIYYNEHNFVQARKWFERSSSDPRFRELSLFYLVDCRFMQKDYDYVIENGETIYPSSPKTRQAHLARLLSESYFVKGNKEKALQYYNNASTDNMTRSDWFYSGSVLYAVQDYEGAVKAYSNMKERTDSLGQIANYQMGNSYVRLRNKVAAMEAFRAASVLGYNADMQEDAHFNYAKLAFDLNKDTRGFTSYISRYNTSRKGDQIYGYMALASLYDRNYAGAVDAYDHIDELDSDMQGNYIKAYYLRAEQLVSSGAWSDAIPCLKAAAYFLPRQNGLGQMSRYWQAESCYKTERYEEAAEIYTDLYNISALDGCREGDLLPYNAAYSLFRASRFEEASRWFDIYLNNRAKLYRNDALCRRADCDFARKDYKSAIESYGRAIAQTDVGEDFYPYYQQALSYGLSGDRKAKAACLSKVSLASSDDPLYYESQYELGRAYMDINKHEEAVSTFTKLSETATDKAMVCRACIGLGMAYRNKKNYDDALSSYKKVVSLMPGSEYASDALLAIESIYQTRKQPEKYLEYVEQNRLDADRSEADREMMYFNTAEQVYLAGNWIQACASLQKYLDSYPSGEKRFDAIFYLAESYKAIDNKEKACSCYAAVKDSCKVDSFRESATINYAEFSYKLGHYPESYQAWSDLVRTARIEDNREAARLGMMRSAYAGRLWEEAIEAAGTVSADTKLDAVVRREANYIRAKSCMSSSRRSEAMKIFSTLASEPSTAEGAEAKYILIQDCFDRGEFDKVQDAVYSFSKGAGEQSYWLARAFITLADTFVEQGNISQAKATYESIRDGYVPSGTEDDIPATVKNRLSRLETL